HPSGEQPRAVAAGERGGRRSSLKRPLFLQSCRACCTMTDNLETIAMTHSPSRRRLLGGAGAALIAGAVSPLAQAQSWATKPVRIIVPYPPGGSSDIIARLISQPLSETLGQTVIVENRAGANGNLGTDAVAKSAADGHTLLLCDVGALAITGSVYTKLAFDPSRDLAGITMLAYSPHMLVVPPSVAANTLAELVALSKKTPLNFAVPAIGSAPHPA